MKILISESAGRNQAWFDNLSKKEQKAYLANHPRSKFGVSKKASAKPAAKPAAKAKTTAAKPAVNQTVKNKLDALRKKLATAKPADLPNIRKQIQAVREQIAGVKAAPSTPAKVKRMGPPSSKRPVNRGAGNTVMGPGWKKKSSDAEWNTYEHPSGHQARVSKTAGTAYQQGMGPVRKVKVHKVETKPAGQKDWRRYGEVEKYRVSDAVSRLK